MSVKVSWLDDQKTTILVTYGAGFNWEEYDRGERTAARMMDSCLLPADILIDFKPVAPPLDYARHLPHIAAHSPFIHHPRAGHVVVCSQTRFMKSMVIVFEQMFNPLPGKLHHARTLDDGIALLKQIRSWNVRL